MSLFYYPNRPTLIPPDPVNPASPAPDYLNSLEARGVFLAEQKFNGDNIYIHTNTMEFWTRHKTKHRYTPPPEVMEEAQQDSLAYKGTFTKSMSVAGVNSEVTYVTSDRFSVPQDEEVLKELKKLVGAKFDDLFETKRNIAIKAEVISNEVLLNKIAKACESAGLSIAEIFDVGDKVVGKDGLDEKQYQLTPEKLEVFRSLVRQNKPALK